ncbi:histidinol-phosphate transaminase [Glaciimonas immobilis]|uniref:Histidinol-phosphate aminotransferase n=1 Tax=Glaciimonas immobilis TaxID=728004 RepID=A0A840RSU0_9BURK|nr:histidinol-phosphate transaminase [Glaciimonas immobilis]KAF3996797.1 histidinol-phosphate transaminase [Glaciimonas immobilis]MBB5199661.1 histidinol-phosphate aminotransferase [Glaciimonas immobilis]
MSKFWSPIVSRLTPYTPGEQPKINNLIKLNTNENPYGPSPLAIAAIQREAADTLRLYPNPDSEPLKLAIAAQNAEYGVTPAHIFVGNGSDEVLAHAFQALLQHDEPILYPDITYSFYPTYSRLYQVAYKTIPLSDDFMIEVDDYLEAGKNGGIIFPNPNAPTGCLLPLSEVERLVAAQPDSVVIVDEAYIDFGGDSAIPLVSRYPNLLVVQTLSKSRSLAGLRVGFAVGHPDLIAALERVKNSFNSYPLDRLAIAGATAAMQDQAHFDRTRLAVMNTRTGLVTGLNALGFEVLPSAANFVFARHPHHDAAILSAGLRADGVIVRHFTNERIAQFLRITVGSDSDCHALLTALPKHLL